MQLRMQHNSLASIIYDIGVTLTLAIVGAVNYNHFGDVILASFWVAFYAGIAWASKEVLSYLKPYLKAYALMVINKVKSWFK